MNGGYCHISISSNLKPAVFPDHLTLLLLLLFITIDLCIDFDALHIKRVRKNSLLNGPQFSHHGIHHPGWLIFFPLPRHSGEWKWERVAIVILFLSYSCLQLPKSPPPPPPPSSSFRLLSYPLVLDSLSCQYHLFVC